MNFLISLLPSVSHLGVWGYWLALLAAFLESLPAIGTFFPGALLVIFAGFMASRGCLEVGDLIWFVAIGVILGDGLSYYLGTKGTKFFRNENRFLKASHLDLGKKFFQKHGSKSVFLARFIVPFRSIIPFVAGVSGMKKRSFFFWNICSIAVWSAAHVLVGYFFGGAFAVVEAWSTRFGYAIGLILLFLALVYGIRFLVIKHGRKIVGLLRSIIVAIGVTIATNPDVKKFTKKHEVFFDFIKARLNRQSFFGLPLTFISIALIYFLILFLGTTQDVLASEPIITTDLRVSNLMVYFRDIELVKVFLWVTLLGKWQFVVGSAICVSTVLWIWKKKDYITYLWLILTSGVGFDYLGKILVRRARPADPTYLETSFSFPSGHAAVAVVFYGFVAYVLVRHLKTWKFRVNAFFSCLVIIIAIGLSRLYLGVHYWSDVWAGYLLGFLILVVATSIYEWRAWGEKVLKTVVFSKKMKLSVIALVLANVVLYVIMGLNYSPLLITPGQDSVKNISGDAVSYFNDNKIVKRTETLFGNPQEPLSFIFLAKNDDDLIRSFEVANWHLADRVDINSMTRLTKAAMVSGQYLNAPVTPYFWNNTINDFGFEKPTDVNNVKQRHHIRIWKTYLKEGDYAVYVGTASLDTGIKWFITHRISPDIDTEKSFIKNSLQDAGVIENAQEVQFVDPILGKNFSRDMFFTDGKLFIVRLN